MNARLAQLFGLAAILMAIAMPMEAQGGCTRSPELPSALLGLVGGGAASLPFFRSWISRKNDKDK
jgi:XrtJ-associated TM-motif-TM protein